MKIIVGRREGLFFLENYSASHKTCMQYLSTESGLLGEKLASKAV